MKKNTRTVTPDAIIINLLTASLEDAGNLFQISRRETSLDLSYVISRTTAEGVSFLTKTLPAFGKHIDLCLRTGKFTTFSAFKKRKGAVLPLFLRRFTDRVFENDGTLMDTPDADAVQMLRQLAFQFYKLEGEYPEDLVDDCIESFVSTDEDLTQCDTIHPEKASIIYEAQQLIQQVFHDFDFEDIIPRPGPGQSAERVPAWERYEPHIRYRCIDSLLPYSRYFVMGGSHLLDSARRLRSLPVLENGESRLMTVPKDSRGPRIICMETTEYMWYQQGLGRAIMRHIERNGLTAGHVNFEDQSVNGSFARDSSISGIHATLDMKEASDRISRNLVEILFQDVPKLRDILLALSTRRIRLPSGGLLETRKYAPMGSALCFPIMSVVHFVLMLAALKHKYPRSSYKALAEDIYVYGDDLICRTDDAAFLMAELPVYGLRFNTDKSCYFGRFRESCGVDAFMGVDVTPQRIKRVRFGKRTAADIPKAFAMFHGFFNRGMWRTAKVWQDLIQDKWKDFPCVSKRSPAVGWIVPAKDVFRANHGRWKSSYKVKRDSVAPRSYLTFRDKDKVEPSDSYYLKARCITPKPWASVAPGWHGVMRWFIENHDRRTTRTDHLNPDSRDSLSFSQRDQVKITWKRIPSFCL